MEANATDSQPSPSSRKRRWWIPIVIAVPLLLLGACGLCSWMIFGNGLETLLTVQSLQLVGNPAPDFTLATTEGGELTLSDLQGQPVLLNFWATWCPDCRKEIPTLVAAADTYDGEVVLVGISDESRRAVEAFADANGMTYPLLLDKQHVASAAYQIRGLPTSYLIDAQGIVAKAHVGEIDEATLDRWLADLGEE